MLKNNVLANLAELGQSKNNRKNNHFHLEGGGRGGVSTLL